MRSPSNAMLEGSSNGTSPFPPLPSCDTRASSCPCGEISTSWLVLGPTSAMYTLPDCARANPSGASFGPLSQSFVRVPGLPSARIELDHARGMLVEQVEVAAGVHRRRLHAVVGVRVLALNRVGPYQLAGGGVGEDLRRPVRGARGVRERADVDGAVGRDVRQTRLARRR